MNRNNRWYEYYKGFTIIQIKGTYRAQAYLYEPMYNTNLSKLKKQIRELLI